MTTYDSGAGFESPYGVGEGGEIPRVSGLAIGALVCALIFCIPGLPLIGVILGLIALVTMVGKEHLRGRGIAIAAVVLGLVFSIGQGIAAWYAVSVGSEVVKLLQEKPAATMRAGFDGDMATFRSSFHGVGATLPDGDAQAFIDELRDRYGAFSDLRFDEASPVRPQPGQPVMDAPYIGTFANGETKANVELIIMDQKTGSFIYKLGAIEFIDSQRGNLRYPPLPSAPGGAAPPSGAP